MSWTEDRVDMLKKLWTEGHSASQIANQLGGVTRNAVIGKVHRLGLSGRATPSRPVKRPPRLARPKPTPQRVQRSTQKPAAEKVASTESMPAVIERNTEPLAPAVLSNGETASVLNIRESMCKWPIGDPMDKNFAFCGRASHDGPYCADHAKVAFQPKKQRARKEQAAGYYKRAAG